VLSLLEGLRDAVEEFGSVMKFCAKWRFLAINLIFSLLFFCTFFFSSPHLEAKVSLVAVEALLDPVGQVILFITSFLSFLLFAATVCN